jgi:copper chaperone CopZ
MALTKTLSDAGYPETTEDVILEIEAMTCASCVGRAERALKSGTGVLDASVNLATETALVSYVAGVTNATDIAPLATPIMVGTGRAAEMGVLFRKGDGTVQRSCFDECLAPALGKTSHARARTVWRPIRRFSDSGARRMCAAVSPLFRRSLIRRIPKPRGYGYVQNFSQPYPDAPSECGIRHVKRPWCQ